MTESLVMCGNAHFLGEVPALGHISGHGFPNPDHTFGILEPTEFCSKFQLTRCHSVRKIGDRRTDKLSKASLVT
jgi:hypothetical protein